MSSLEVRVSLSSRSNIKALASTSQEQVIPIREVLPHTLLKSAHRFPKLVHKIAYFIRRNLYVSNKVSRWQNGTGASERPPVGLLNCVALA